MSSTTFALLALVIYLAAVPIALQQNSEETDDLKMDDYIVIHDKGQNLFLQVALQESSKGMTVNAMWDPSDEDVDVFCLDPSTGDRAYHLSKRKTIVFRDKSITFQDKVLHMEFDPCGDQLFWNTESGIYGWKVNADSYQLIYSLISPNKILCITLDLNRGHVYWTQNDNTNQKGEIWRMRTDGSNVTKVFTARTVLHAITIDHELYMLNVMTASGDMLYMMPLDLMEEVKDVQSPVHIDYETKRYVKTESILFDIVSYRGRIYFVHPESGRIFRFSVVLGPSSMEEYGNVTILRSESISFFSGTHYDRNIAGLRRCKVQPVHSDEKEITSNPTRPTPAPSLQYDKTSTTTSAMSTGGVSMTSSVQNDRTTSVTTSLRHPDDSFQSTTDEVLIDYSNTTITLEVVTNSSDEDSDVVLRPTTRPYVSQQTEKLVGKTTSDLVIDVKTTLQQTSTTKPMRVSTSFLSSKTEAKPSVSQQDTFIPLIEVSALGLDRTHPCFKILEQPSGEKTAVSRAFQLCARLSGLLQPNSDERS